MAAVVKTPLRWLRAKPTRSKMRSQRLSRARRRRRDALVMQTFSCVVAARTDLKSLGRKAVRFETLRPHQHLAAVAVGASTRIVPEFG